MRYFKHKIEYDKELLNKLDELIRKCYQKLEEDIIFILENGFREYKRLQDIREELLKDMLDNFNEGRSKSYYCIVATVMKIEDIKEALVKAIESSYGLDIRSRSKVLHSLLDEIAQQNQYYLGLRKRSKI